MGTYSSVPLCSRKGPWPSVKESLLVGKQVDLPLDFLSFLPSASFLQELCSTLSRVSSADIWTGNSASTCTAPAPFWIIYLLRPLIRCACEQSV